MEEVCSFSPADILIPFAVDEKWPVIACDQYTSEPEYWEDVKSIVGESKSTLNLILPECFLSDKTEEKITAVNENMKKYIDSGVFKTYENALIYVERIQSDGRMRKGIIGKIDLKSYDYMPNSNAEIRATEKTVVSRIPPRVNIRKNAPLELPHAMLLIDDKKDLIIENLSRKTKDFKLLYDTKLMKNGGSIKGYLIDSETAKSVLDGLSKLKQENNGFLFCVGDGNHSLAAAKECYNSSKSEKERYALCEIVNIHDSSLGFEPIYRVVFGVKAEKIIADFLDYCGGEYNGSDAQEFTVVSANIKKKISVKPIYKLPVSTLQAFLDGYGKETDYIHGEESVIKISKRENCVGFLFKGMEKSELFTSVLKDGSLPRKTFSMGNADDKRFYLEARKIK